MECNGELKEDLHLDLSKYSFWRALRPFSFTVALVICLTGITSAAVSTSFDPLSAILVLTGGLLLQAGVNLINDYADRQQLRQESGNAAHLLALNRVEQNFRVGMGCFLLASAIAFYLVSQVGTGLLWLALIGLIGALGYTLEPINYKRRGLGVVLVFWFMGVLMVAGSYFAVSGELTAQVLCQSLPVSLLTALLLLSNELRDYEADQRDGIDTLSVRIGFAPAVTLYIAAVLLTYLSAVLLWANGALQSFWPLLPSLLCLPAPYRLLRVEAVQRKPLTPLTGRLFLVFGLGYCLALAI
ncbi:prenyltransferase [Pontibacterium granulatum]|uniref:prenyltransferase n=1 Tax=Pontibacterium granulatum TaxID=2036029 RepID=UPI00249B680B|nr:prenyltransferase [Pontibacterium granulatum]MDI3323251.1 prenyltransferase [Pontibacterium granulatum]